MNDIKCKHLENVNENYFRHFLISLIASVKLFIAAFVLLIHAIFPFVLVHTGSNLVQKILIKLKARKCQSLGS